MTLQAESQTIRANLLLSRKRERVNRKYSKPVERGRQLSPGFLEEALEEVICHSYPLLIFYTAIKTENFNGCYMFERMVRVGFRACPSTENKRKFRGAKGMKCHICILPRN